MRIGYLSIALFLATGCDHDTPRPANKGVNGDPLPRNSISRLGTSWLVQDTPVSSIAIDNSGSLAVSGGPTGDMTVWDLNTGRARLTISTGCAKYKARRALSVSLSPDGRWALSGGERIRLWDVATGTLVREMKIHHDENSGMIPETIGTIRFSPDGRRALTAGYSCILWDLESGEPIRTLEKENKGYGMAGAFTPDGKKALSDIDDQYLKLWDLDTGKPIRVIPHEGPIMDLAVSPDGKRALTAGPKNVVSLWDLESGIQLKALCGHEGTVMCVAFNSDGKKALSGSVDEQVKLWDLDAGKEIHTFRGHRGDVMGVAFTPDGKKALSGGAGDRQLIVWDIEAKKRIRLQEGHLAPIMAASFDRDGRNVLTAAADGRFVRWDTATGKVLQDISHEFSMFSVAFGPGGEEAIMGSKSGSLVTWDLKAGKQNRLFEGLKDAVSAVAISPDGRHAYTGIDGAVKAWDLDTGKCVRTFPLIGRVAALAMGIDGCWMASSSGVTKDHGAIVSLWDTESGQCLSSTEVGMLWVDSLSLSSDGRRVLCGDTGGSVMMIDLETGKKLYDLSPGLDAWGTNATYSYRTSTLGVAFTPDGVWTATSSSQVVLREADSGEALERLVRQWPLDATLCMSLTGRRFVSSSGDHTALVWQPYLEEEERARVWHESWNKLPKVAQLHKLEEVLEQLTTRDYQQWCKVRERLLTLGDEAVAPLRKRYPPHKIVLTEYDRTRMDLLFEKLNSGRKDEEEAALAAFLVESEISRKWLIERLSSKIKYPAPVELCLRKLRDTILKPWHEPPIDLGRVRTVMIIADLYKSEVVRNALEEYATSDSRVDSALARAALRGFHR